MGDISKDINSKFANSKVKALSTKDSDTMY
jgi:hypothetical protein